MSKPTKTKEQWQQEHIAEMPPLRAAFFEVNQKTAAIVSLLKSFQKCFSIGQLQLVVDVATSLKKDKEKQ